MAAWKHITLFALAKVSRNVERTAVALKAKTCNTETLILCQLNLKGAILDLYSARSSLLYRGEADVMSINQQETVRSLDRLESSALPKRPKKGQTPE